MTRHVSAEQVRRWLDETAVRGVTHHDEADAEFNFQVELSRLPIHVVKEEPWGPVRIVGRTGFDSDRAKELLCDDERRGELLRAVGPMLAATPGFYTFLDEEGAPCELRHAETIQLEYRVYPDGASQQTLMNGVMAVGKGMRYVRSVIVSMGTVDDGP
ncbi:hypothetical protein [Salinilacihabitans rarus]|uniref:hypothetical protein n=1 Tax=Salinilacihabitans rarus TaxID=2961596 RepID=UPI0020C891FF|nr:hypothetical protein [Salinilacihabitans rarus]